MSTITNYSKSIAESTHREVENTLSRAAEVVQVKGQMVRVRFTEEAEAGETWFPCTDMHVPVGTWGIVQKLRDNAGCFQPIGLDHDERYYTEAEVDALLAAKQTEFSRASGSPLTENTSLIVSTFTQAKSLWLTTLADLIPATATGTWSVKVTASATVNRAVTTGGMYLFVSINGNDRSAIPRGFPQDSAYAVTRTHVVSGCTGASELEVRYGGQATAGQTNVWNWDVDITAVRTG